MSSTAAAASAGDVFPALPPIKTAPSPPAEAAACSSSPSTAPGAEAVPLPPAPAEGEEEEGQGPEEPTTPTSEESRLRAPVECPPAPRKPAPAAAVKRKWPSSSAPSARRAFFPVARDLSAVFRSLPPKKRVRAG